MISTTRLRGLSLAQLVFGLLASVVWASHGEREHGSVLFPRKDLTDAHRPGRGNKSDWGDERHKDGHDAPRDAPWHKDGKHGKPKPKPKPTPEHYTLAHDYHAHNILDQFKFMTASHRHSGVTGHPS